MPDIEAPASLDDSMATVIEQTKLRILHALRIFPYISGSMMHQALGTSTSIDLWKPILKELIDEGKVEETSIQQKTPTGRMQSYTIYHLPENKYPLELEAAL
jgi:hypothetical protein